MKTIKSNTITNRRIPRRTCVACRQVKAKRNLVRVVRTPEGKIEIDDTGKKNGRGAYICPNRDCIDKALKGSRLEHTLKSPITGEESEKLGEYFKSLSEGVN